MQKLYLFNQIRAFLEILYKSFLNIKKIVYFEIANNII